MSRDTRYDRQVKLAEVGAAGQACIEAWQPQVPAQLAAGAQKYMALYCERMGMGGVADAVAEPLAQELSAHFRHAGSRAVGLGAAAALANVLSALQAQSDSDAERPESA